MSIRVHFQKLPHFGDLELPGYATDQSAGMDLRAAVTDPLILNPGERRVIPCGFSMELPAGFEAQVRPRSGLAAKNGITVLNAPGTIDADYRGEVMVILINHGQESFTINRGERIAQMIVAPVTRVEWDVKSSLSVTRRGEGGFGHTGKH